MELQGKRLLIIGGGNVIDEIVRFAKKNNVVLISAGNVKTANIHNISSEQYYIDVTDNDLMKKFIKEHNIDGVFSCSGESVIPHSIEYTTELGLPCYATKEQWNVLMNKRNLMDECAKYGMDIIPEYKYNLQTKKADRNITYPVVVKPVDNGGSLGISVCNNEDELQKAIGLAYEFSKSQEILIEQFIDAPYYQLEVYLQNGKAYLGYTKERIFYAPKSGCPKQPFIDIYPSSQHERIKKELFPKFSKMLLDLGIKNGTVQLQGLINDKHIYIMDVAYRLSGGMDYRPVQQEKGINIVENHLEYALTGQWNGPFELCNKPYENVYATICVGIENGVIKTVSGVDKIQAKNNVYDYFQYYHEGDVMTYSGRFQQTFCRIFTHCKTYEEIKEQTEEILNLLDIRDENGAQMLLNYSL